MRRFLIGFGLVTLLVAGALSYLADPDPDGLEAATQRGCTESAAGELAGELADEQAGELAGECVARGAKDSPLAGSPLAGYTVRGEDRLTGVAGVLGAVVTLGVAGGVFWLLRARRPTR